ncbi:MAG: ADP-ribose pyrophosphatase [Chlamydiae bacterium]|nr:ADP-ribose pyrophosphatase [Chlamydiota bacterium]
MINSLKQKELESQAIASEKRIFEGKVFSVIREDLKFEGLPPHFWEIVQHPGAVALLPVTQKGTLLLIQQWRRPVEKILYEIPAGTLKKNEIPEKAAIRELQEEIGYLPKTLIPFGGLYSAPGFCSEYIHLYIAKDLSESTLPADDHEAIDIVELSLEEALGFIDDGTIQDAKTIISLLRYQRLLETHA